MSDLARRVERTYLGLSLGNTLAGSFIWGINTLFLLDAGLTNLEAFAANAFFAGGMVVFEVPTGVVADTWGRRTSYLLGTVTLAVSTLLYWMLWRMHAPFWPWAAASVMLGLGFTFFSGAVEAWLVDALTFAGYDGDLDRVLGRGQMVSGAAMLGGALAGGVIAQATNLGVPYLLRTAVLVVTFVAAFAAMRDHGFTPQRLTHPVAAVRGVLRGAIDGGWNRPSVRWAMLAAPFASGAGFYAFYAVQPYLLQIHGQANSYAIAGIAAALVAGAQIAGGWLAPRLRARVEKRTTAIIVSVVIGSVAMMLLGAASMLVIISILIALWGLASAVGRPIRQAYLNGMIPATQRATVLSFDSLMGSLGGVVLQPLLGEIADRRGYPLSFVAAGLVAMVSLPFMIACRRLCHPADTARPVDKAPAGLGGC